MKDKKDNTKKNAIVPISGTVTEKEKNIFYVVCEIQGIKPAQAIGDYVRNYGKAWLDYYKDKASQIEVLTEIDNDGQLVLSLRGNNGNKSN